MFTTSTLTGLLIYGVIACFIMKIVIKVFAPDLFKDMAKQVAEAINGKGTEPEAYPYVSCGSILTPTELAFFNTLLPVINGQWHIFTKVRLEDIIKVKKGVERKVAYGFRSRIKSRHIDFVLCEKDTLEILMCIELDDRSHQTAKAQKADQFKNQALKDADLTLTRIPARASYSEAYLRGHLFEEEAVTDAPHP